jgi:hypothetical protein
MCTYTRDVSLHFNFLITLSSYLAQQSSIQYNLAYGAKVPLTSVVWTYREVAAITIGPPPNSGGSAVM